MYTLRKITSKNAENPLEISFQWLYNTAKHRPSTFTFTGSFVKHYNDVTLGIMEPHITGNTPVVPPFVSANIAETSKPRATGLLRGEYTGDRWIFHAKGQLHWRRFHGMISSWGSGVMLLLSFANARQYFFCEYKTTVAIRDKAMCYDLWKYVNITLRCNLYINHESRKSVKCDFCVFSVFTIINVPNDIPQQEASINLHH